MNAKRILFPIIPLGLFFLGWEFLVSAGILNRGLFPPPSAIARELASVFEHRVDGTSLLTGHYIATLRRLFVAAVEGSLAGVVLGVAMGLSRRIYRFFDPIITLIMPIPGIAMAPLFIVWMGFGDPTIITVGAIAAFFPVAYNTSTGVRSIDPQLIRAAQVMGVKPIPILLQVYVPWAAVYILTGIKLGLARSWRTVIAVEFIAAANWGMGYMVWDAAEYLRAALVYGGIILLAVTFAVLERGLIGPVERATIEKWGMVKA